MDALQFSYWLQGFTELQPDLEAPTPEQWKAIREHLALVFTKVTPPGNGYILQTKSDPLFVGPATATC
jgi:hypothetical protein